MGAVGRSAHVVIEELAVSGLARKTGMGQGTHRGLANGSRRVGAAAIIGGDVVLGVPVGRLAEQKDVTGHSRRRVVVDGRRHVRLIGRDVRRSQLIVESIRDADGERTVSQRLDVDEHRLRVPEGIIAGRERVPEERCRARVGGRSDRGEVIGPRVPLHGVALVRRSGRRGAPFIAVEVAEIDRRLGAPRRAGRVEIQDLGAARHRRRAEGCSFVRAHHSHEEMSAHRCGLERPGAGGAARARITREVVGGHRAERRRRGCAPEHETMDLAGVQVRDVEVLVVRGGVDITDPLPTDAVVAGEVEREQRTVHDAAGRVGVRTGRSCERQVVGRYREIEGRDHSSGAPRLGHVEAAEPLRPEARVGAHHRRTPDQSELPVRSQAPDRAGLREVRGRTDGPSRPPHRRDRTRGGRGAGDRSRADAHSGQAQ